MTGSSTNTELPQDPIAHMGQLSMHLFSGYLLRSALAVQLPDHLGAEPTSVTELARRTGTEPARLRQLLRTLSTLGYFRPAGQDRYEHTELSTALSTAPMRTFIDNDWIWPLWEQLPDALRTGRVPFPELHGKNFYDYLDEDAPELSEGFNASMTNGPGSSNDAVSSALDLSTANTVVDVGGGEGTLLRDLLIRNPHLRGVLFDMESALKQADEQLRTGSLSDRCELVVGDVRESAPTADAYVLRMILHNWEDESCVRMLSSLARAARPGARVHVVELLLPEDEATDATTAMMDMMMFMLFGSGERTASQYADLFAQAGLTYVGHTPTSSSFSIIEARVRD